MNQPHKAAVFGNVALDILCLPVDDVPRHDCISFQQSSIAPGGCASNVAVGLHTLQVPVSLVARIADDDPGALIERFWDRVGLDHRYVQVDRGLKTGVSIGLVDSSAQPRFIHTPGSSGDLTVDDLPLDRLAEEGIRFLHIAGFFVLPGLLDGRLPAKLAEARRLGITTSLDVVNSPRMDDPARLWECLPELDYFFCNRNEAARMTGKPLPSAAAHSLRQLGAGAALVKMGVDGVWVDSPSFVGQIPTHPVAPVDSTGAGDAFAAGFIAACMDGAGLEDACRNGNACGARIVKSLGAVEGWFKDVDV